MSEQRPDSREGRRGSITHLEADGKAFSSVGEYERSCWRARVVAFKDSKRCSNEASQVDGERLSKGVEADKNEMSVSGQISCQPPKVRACLLEDEDDQRLKGCFLDERLEDGCVVGDEQFESREERTVGLADCYGAESSEFLFEMKERGLVTMVERTIRGRGGQKIERN
jgi:hypothetical protein